MSARRTVRFTVLALCVLVATEFGVRRAWRDATMEPPSPPPVCQLIRPEVFDLLVPDHGPLTADGEEGSAPGTRSNTCSAETASAPGGSHAALWVALVRLGRRDGQGPRCESTDGALYQPLNRRTRPLALGDRALYFFDGDPAADRTVHLSACLGTYLVYVDYSAVGVTDAALAEAATVVAQEVLSWR